MHLLGTVKTTGIDNFQIPMGLGHRESCSVSPTVILVVSYYLLS